MTGFGYQPFFGLQYQPTDRLLIGLVYRAKADIELKGDVLFRKFDDTWHAGIAYVQDFNKNRRISFGFSYDSSPVSDANRTIDLPFDETIKFSTSYSVLGAGNFDYAFGATLFVFGDGKVDQTAQGVRFVGEFDSNHMLMIGATIRPKSK